jgi:hypothetical protein
MCICAVSLVAVLALCSSQIDSVHPLELLPCLGYLNVSSTAVSLQSLLVLRAMHILELVVDAAGSKLAPQLSLSPQHSRLLVVHLLPRVWVLDGLFVTQEERWAAQEFAQREADAALAPIRCVTRLRSASLSLSLSLSISLSLSLALCLSRWDCR